MQSRAIELDPLFAAAYVGLSFAYFWAGFQYQTMQSDEATRLGAMHANKAVELDPGDAGAQAEWPGPYSCGATGIMPWSIATATFH
jgi:hypothetical protein